MPKLAHKKSKTNRIVLKGRSEWAFEIAEFKKICRTNGVFMSEILMGFVREFLKRNNHKTENKLSKYVGAIKKQCFICKKYFLETSLKRVRYISGLEFLTCPLCLAKNQKHHLVKRIRGIRL